MAALAGNVTPYTYSASGCVSVATKSVASRLLTSRMRSAPVTSTTSYIPEATPRKPCLIAEAPDAGPFSTVSAPAGASDSVSTTADASPVWWFTRALPMFAT